jgi:hypothetical protein
MDEKIKEAMMRSIYGGTRALDMQGMTHSADALKYAISSMGQLKLPVFPTPFDFSVAKKRPAMKEPRGWKFKAPHTDVIDVQEIGKYVTRKNPLVIVKFDHGAWGLVHDGIVAKARNCAEDEEFNLKETKLPKADFSVVFLKHKDIKSLISWVKKIRGMEWKAKNNKNVSVFIPEI